MADYGRDLRRLLREHGCRFERQAAGSHEIWYSPITNHYFAVPVRILKRHTANGILKQAGVGKRF